MLQLNVLSSLMTILPYCNRNPYLMNSHRRLCGPLSSSRRSLFTLSDWLVSLFNFYYKLIPLFIVVLDLLFFLQFQTSKRLQNYVDEYAMHPANNKRDCVTSITIQVCWHLHFTIITHFSAPRDSCYYNRPQNTYAVCQSIWIALLARTANYRAYIDAWTCTQCTLVQRTLVHWAIHCAYCTD